MYLNSRLSRSYGSRRLQYPKLTKKSHKNIIFYYYFLLFCSGFFFSLHLLVNYPFLDFYSTTKIQINISSSLLTRLSKFSCLAFWSIIILFFPVSIGLSSGLQGEEVKGGQGAPGLYLEVKGGGCKAWRTGWHGKDMRYTIHWHGLYENPDNDGRILLIKS